MAIKVLLRLRVVFPSFTSYLQHDMKKTNLPHTIPSRESDILLVIPLYLIPTERKKKDGHTVRETDGQMTRK